MNFIMLHIYGEALDRLRVRLNMYILLYRRSLSVPQKK